MKSAKIVSIQDLWKRAQEKSEADGAGENEQNWPNFDAEHKPTRGEAVSTPETDESTSEVRFEKIIEAKERIKNHYYDGDRVGMDILKSIFSGEIGNDDDDLDLPANGDVNDADDS